MEKHVSSKQKPPADGEEQSVLNRLFSSDEDSHVGVSMIRVKDKGSQPQCVPVELEAVPVYRAVGSGADITIIGGKVLHRVPAIVKLRKKNLPFAAKTMTTPAYIKPDAEEHPLLSEGVYRKLGTNQYHCDLEPGRICKDSYGLFQRGRSI